MKLKIRNAVESDFDELDRIASKHGKDWFGVEDVKLPLKYSPELCFVIEESNKIVGANLFVKLNKGIAYWTLWFIDPDFERKGFGKELNDVALNYLKKHGIKTVIGTLDKNNKKIMDMLTKKLKWKNMGKIGNEMWIYKDF